jgi:hypothetical protein
MRDALAPFILGLVAGTGAMLVIGWRRGRLARAIALCAAGLLAIWAAAVLAIVTDYRDADGTFDCWPRCTRFQDAVGGALVYPLPLVVLVGILFVVLVAVSARRRRAAHPHG